MPDHRPPLRIAEDLNEQIGLAVLAGQAGDFGPLLVELSEELLASLRERAKADRRERTT